MRIIATLGTETESAKDYEFRRAVRAVVFDIQGKVALLHASRRQYYKLPGGGIEAGEDAKESLRRECLEEIGCKIEIDEEIGQIIEYRDVTHLKQESFCFKAHVIGDKGKPEYTESEIREGFRHLWVGIEEAIKLMESSVSTDGQEDFIRKRDTLILNTVKESL